jgi:release factor glutamine methyltransferase
MMLHQTTQHLREGEVENPFLNARIIIGKVLGLSPVDLVLSNPRILAKNEIKKINEYSSRRILGEPLQYIIEETEFYGLLFHIDRRVLIPRPETEILVEWGIDLLTKIKNPRVLDIGTGSGIIAIALAVNTNCQVLAVDKSLSALQLAAANSRSNQVRDKIEFALADVYTEDFATCVGGNFDLVVSNPPYVASREMNDLPPEIHLYEPKDALTDGADGLSFYRRLHQIAPLLCKKNGWILMETADARAKECADILSPVLSDIQIRNDLSGKSRVVGGKCSLK